MPENNDQISAEINQICAELCKVVDGDFSVYIEPKYKNDAANKITMMINFLVNSVVDALDEKEKLHEKIYQTKKLESISTMSAGIAHDFNNILSVTQGYIELLKKDASSPQSVINHAEKIEHALNDASAMVKSLLTFSSSSVKSDEVVNINDIIRQNSQLLKGSLGQFQQCELLLASDLLPVNAETTAVTSMLVNFLINAKHAMAKEGRVQIRTENVVDSSQPTGKKVMIAVSDNGCGIKKSDQSKVFDPFFSTKQIGKGHGLGLSSIFGIVKKYNGQIKLYSNEGRGTTFKVYFPVCEQAHLTTGNSTAEGVEEESKTHRILFVDDNKDICEVYQQIFESQGSVVQCFTDAVEALSYYQQHWREVDVVITDLMMPNLLGTEWLKQAFEINHNLKAILCTGYGSDKVIEELKNALSNQLIVLHKPVRSGDMWQKIRELLQ
ncbi:MAG: ATP-binding protein [Coxiellaceae bacterium]|nr:ATP-binding protein [Coxiellaceae bacterium]